MNEPARPAAASAAPSLPRAVPALAVFAEFLTIGATSFGGAVPYLRQSLVVRRGWLDETAFVELLSISQSLPGLNATNMAILVGQRLAGRTGAALAILGMCLPGAILMFAVGIVYRAHGDHPITSAALKGVSAAAVGLILSTVVQLGKKSLADYADYVFVAVTVLMVNLFHQSVLTTLVAVGLMSILWRRPRATAEE
jgi:chromate transporter